jgi:hypothetical protein
MLLSPIAYYISDGLVEMIFASPIFDLSIGDKIRVFTNHSSDVNDVIEHIMTVLLISDDYTIIRVNEWKNIHDTYEKILIFDKV